MGIIGILISLKIFVSLTVRFVSVTILEVGIVRAFFISSAI